MLPLIPLAMLALIEDLKRTWYKKSKLPVKTKFGKKTSAESYISFSASFLLKTDLTDFFFLDSTNVSMDAWKMKEVLFEYKYV